MKLFRTIQGLTPTCLFHAENETEIRFKDTLKLCTVEHLY